MACSAPRAWRYGCRCGIPPTPRHPWRISAPRSGRRLRAETSVPSPSDPPSLTEDATAEAENAEDTFGLTELFDEVRDPQALGSRGEGWMMAVVLACSLLIAPPVNLFGLIRAVGWILACAGLTLFSYGVLALGRSNFPLPFPRKNAEFVQSGVYARVRHPQYGGVLLFAIGLSAITRSETRGAFCLLLWFLLEQLIRFEERILKDRFDAYSLYCDQTAKLIPGMY